jgi:hypothetical protein
MEIVKSEEPYGFYDDESKPLEIRMYFFVNYQLTGIQSGIQALHSALRYARKFGGENSEIWDFIDNHETCIVLDGGTTNDRRELDGQAVGTLNQIGDALQDNEIDFTHFNEPDLNDALTALCFLVDERVFNKKDYPDFIDWLLDVKMYQNAKDEALTRNPELWARYKLQPPEALEELFPEYFKEWVRLVGGLKNVFLRELLRGKKLATN